MGALAAHAGVGYSPTTPTDEFLSVEPRVPIAARSRGVVWGHSSGGHYYEPWPPQNNVQPLLRALVDVQRRPFICPERISAVARSWGNDAGQTYFGEAKNWLQANLGGPSGPVVGGAVSEGGVTLLNAAHSNPADYCALALFFPIVDMAAAYAGLFTAQIDTAYGGAAAWAAAAPTHDPALYPEEFTDWPILMFQASNDIAMLPQSQVDFCDAVNAAGGDATLIDLGPVGHANFTSIDQDVVLDFLEPYVR